jgi:hypothetical protein
MDRLESLAQHDSGTWYERGRCPTGSPQDGRIDAYTPKDSRLEIGFRGLKMLFDYQPYERVSKAEESNLIYRPEVQVILMGSSDAIQCQALVDTGSDNTIFPRSLCEELGIAISAETAPAKGFGGQDLPLRAGTVRLALECEQDTCHWIAPVMFFDFADPEDETVVLGHAGFLDYFTATFDGQQKQLRLVPNDHLPILET